MINLDLTTQLLTNPDVLSILLVFVFYFIFLIQLIFKAPELKGGRIFSITVVLVLMAFFIQIGAMSGGFAYIYAIFISVLITRFWKDTFIGDGAIEKEQVILIYCVFFLVLIFIQGLIGVNIILGNIGQGSNTCGSFSLSSIACFFGQIFQLFSLNSVVGWFNIGFLIPFTILLVMYAISRIPFIGGG